MLNNQPTQIIVVLHKDDQEALAQLLTQLAKHTTDITFTATVNNGHPILTLCFASLNSLSYMVTNGLIAGIDTELSSLFLIDEVMSTVDSIAIYDEGIPIDKMIIAPRVSRSFGALATLYHQVLTEDRPRDNHHLPSRDIVPGFMDLTKTRKVVRSVDSMFGDPSKRTFERHSSRRGQFEHSIHYPQAGVNVEIRGKDLFLRIDGQVLRRRGEDISDSVRSNMFSSQLLRGVSNNDLMEAIADYPNVELISFSDDVVIFTVTVEPKEKGVSNDGLYYLHGVRENINLLTLTLTDSTVLTNVKVPDKAHPQLKGSITNDLLELGDKTRKELTTANYQYTGAGVELVFNNEDLAKEYIANIEAKRKPTEEPVATDALTENKPGEAEIVEQPQE